MAEAYQESEVRSPSLFERAREGIHHAKEEIGAVLHRDHSGNHHEPQPNPEVELKSQSLLERAKEKIEQAKEEIGAVSHHIHLHHEPESKLESLVSDLHIHHEPESKVESLIYDSGDAVTELFKKTKKELESIMDRHKPQHHDNIFERAKKEMEELAHSIHQKKREHHFEHKAEDCMSHIGSWFENICAPKTYKRD